MVKVFDNNGERNNFTLSDSVYILWLAICMIMGFGVYFIIPFPLSLVASLAIFLLMNITMKRYAISVMKKKYGYNNDNAKTNKNGGLKGFFNSISASLYADPYNAFGYQPLKFYCMDCGKEHEERKCPVCGSMAVRVG